MSDYHELEENFFEQLNDLKIAHRWTKYLELYQVEVLWAYKCKGSSKIHYRLGTSTKTEELNDYNYEELLIIADKSAREKFHCSPTWLQRVNIKIIKYTHVKPRDLINLKPTVGFKEYNKTHKEKINKMDYGILKKYYKTMVQERGRYKDFLESLTDKQRSYYNHTKLAYRRVFNRWRNEK